MKTNTRLGRLAGAGALAALVFTAACESDDSTGPTGLEPPAVALNQTMLGYVQPNSVVVCQLLDAGSPQTGTYQVNQGGGVVATVDITGDAELEFNGTDNFTPIPGPGCAEVYSGGGTGTSVTLTNGVSVSASGNRLFTSVTNTFNTFTSPTFNASNGAVLWFKVTLDEPETGIEGCTPGAWRNQDGTGRNGRNRWTGTPYDLTTTFESVFGDVLGPEYDGLTLREALDFNANVGGEALLKHAAAAALNAAHVDVDYPYSLATVISDFAAAWADLEADDNATKDKFDAANNLGCPI